MILFWIFCGFRNNRHAIFEQNKEDSISRKSIIVQLPEVLLESNREQKAAYSFCIKNNLKPTISELTKERLRRAGKKFVKTIQTGMVMLVFVFSNSIHLISVRGKPQQKPFHNSLMPM
jgi:hypothetical protein